MIVISGKLAALVAFIAVQLFIGVMVMIIRYHFHAFGIPGDLRAKTLVTLFTVVAVILCAWASTLYAVGKF